MYTEHKNGRMVHIVKIEPELDKCVETKTRNEYDRFCSLLVSGVRDEEIIERLEILRLFLQTANFKKLRSESEKLLVAGRKVRFIIYRVAGKMEYEIEVE